MTRIGSGRPRRGMAALAVWVVASLSVAQAQPPTGQPRAPADPPAAVLQAPELPRHAPRPAPPAGAPWTGADGADHQRRDAARRGAASTQGSPTPHRAPDDAARDREWRERGEREREVRAARGALAPPLEPMPRIGADPPPMPAVVPPPRIVIPQAGEPGGPPIALPTCGPAGCFDANGRPLSGTGNRLMSPDGTPCERVGSGAICR